MLVSPLDGGIMGRRYNTTLHGRSVHRKANVSGHNVIIGYLSPGTGDALDIFEPPSTVVRAMHDGEVTRIVDRNGRLSYVKISGLVNGKRVITCYAHIYVRASLMVGTKVKAGELIGWVGRILKDPHLHLEVQVSGRSVNDPRPKCLACKIDELID